MVRYENGIVYMLTKKDDNTIYYVGSTVKTLQSRIINHKHDSKRYPNRYLYIEVNKIGWDMFKFDVIEKLPCDDLQTLRKREQFYANELKPLFNTKVSSTGINFNGNYKDYSKEYAKTEMRKKVCLKYYQNHKEEQKRYKYENKEKIIEQRKKHYQDNIEEMRLRKKNDYKKHRETRLEKITCECGCTVAKMTMKKHQTTKKHLSYTTS